MGILGTLHHTPPLFCKNLIGILLSKFGPVCSVYAMLALILSLNCATKLKKMHQFRDGISQKNIHKPILFTLECEKISAHFSGKMSGKEGSRRS